MRRLKKLSERPRTSGLLAGCLAAVALLGIPSAASAVTFRPTRTDDPPPNGCKKKDCSLRDAVIAANAAQGGMILLRPGKHYELTRKGAGENAGLTGDLDVSLGVEPFDVSLGIEVRTKGQRGPMATIDANGIDRVFDGSPTLDRVILRDGHARVAAGDHGDGGAVRGFPRVIDSRFVNNTSDARGGAIFFSRGPSQISRSAFKGNKAAGDGGAVYFLQACNGPEGHFAFGKSRATHNSARGDGGAIFSYCGLDIGRSYISDNSARGSGGGIFTPGATVPPDATTPDPSEWRSSVTMSGSTLARNRSQTFGGGLGIDAGAFATVSHSTISGNKASSAGGIGINAPPGGPTATLEVENSTIANNGAGRDGGGIGSNAPGDSRSYTTVKLDYVTIARNQANMDLVGGAQREGAGGGIFMEGDDSVSVHDSLVALNTAASRPTARASDCATVGGGTPLLSLGHNLIGNAIGGYDFYDCTGFGAADFFGGKLKLGKLADNGGRTKTIALMKGSRAIGRAEPDAVRVDQRGVKRDKKPDIGAYERRAKK
jgi:predicted outer membrane repeat protein